MIWSGTDKHGGDTLFTLVASKLWKERNTRCFRGANMLLPQLLAMIRFETAQWVEVGATNLGCLLLGVIAYGISTLGRFKAEV